MCYQCPLAIMAQHKSTDSFKTFKNDIRAGILCPAVIVAESTDMLYRTSWVKLQNSAAGASDVCGSMYIS